ncbi:MAG: CoA-binding protein [bacterium]|nr:CoA-binding protein [bacterium]
MTDQEIYNHEPIAIFGVSSQRKSFGTAVFQELRKKGTSVYAINPKGGMVDGQTVFTSLKQLPERAAAAVILVRGEGAIEAVEECSREGVNIVWLQGASNTPELRKLCKELELQLVSGPCILMPMGGFPHNVHRFFYNLFGGNKKPENESAASV